MAVDANNADRSRKSARDPRDEEDRGFAEGFGGLIDDLTSNLPMGDTLARLVGTTERVTKAQQAAYSALGLPSAQDLERLTLRIRSLFHRVDEMEDDLDALERRLSALERKPPRAAKKS